jgi:hypothetical protein
VKASFSGSNCIAHQGGSSNNLDVTQNEFRIAPPTASELLRPRMRCIREIVKPPTTIST